MSLEQFAVTILPRPGVPLAVVREDDGGEGALYGAGSGRCDWGLRIGANFSLCFSLDSGQLEGIDSWARPRDAASASFQAVLPKEFSFVELRRIDDKARGTTVVIDDGPARVDRKRGVWWIGNTASVRRYVRVWSNLYVGLRNEPEIPVVAAVVLGE